MIVNTGNGTVEFEKEGNRCGWIRRSRKIFGKNYVLGNVYVFG